MKRCKDCKLEKDESLFYGLQNECKECTKARVKENHKRVGNSYDVTEHGVIRVIYKAQVRNSKTRGHKPPDYTKAELKDWLYSQGYKGLYDKWVRGGMKKDEKPSVDRLDDFKPYSMDNIRLTTWFENRNKQYKDMMSGRGTGGQRCKKLVRAKGDESTTYVSYWSAVRDIGYSVEYQIKTGKTCRNGYTWRYI